MNSIGITNRRAGYFAIALALAVAAVLPALVSAAQVTERSIELSNSSVSASGVNYRVQFTAPSAATGMVIDFCSNTPLLGESCTAPTGFSSTSPVATGFTVTSAAANNLKLVGTIAAGANDITVSGMTNPSSAGAMYARITTYASGNESTYSSATALGTVLDDGGIALSITPTIGVSGAVLESMTFCVSGEAITNCTTTTAPVLRLGETVGSVVALDAGAVSDGSIFTQISTNAANGAVISLKSNAFGCGGLLRAGSPAACDIQPAQATDIAAGQAKFGVKTTTAGGTGTGTLQPVTASGYNNSTFALNYTAADAAGVTSTFGDLFLDTNNQPANAKGMELIFGASISSDTPAGLYSADMSLIATGKF